MQTITISISKLNQSIIALSNIVITKVPCWIWRSTNQIFIKTYFQEKIFKSNLHEYIVLRKDLQIKSSWISTYFQEKIFKSNWHYIFQDFVRFYGTFMGNEASHEFLDKNTHSTAKITMKLSKNLTKFIKNTMSILTQGVEISTYIFTSLYLQEHFLSK